MTDHVLRAYGDVTCDFLTEVLRERGWIGDATVVDAPAETVGAGLMGICARYQLRLDREVPGAPRSVVGKFAAQDATAREFMASSGYPNELCFYRHFAFARLDPCTALRVRRDRRRRVVHAHPRRLRADGAGRSATRLHRGPS